MKKILLPLTFLICFFVFNSNIAAETEIRVVLNGASVAFDVAPQNMNGRILVPLRAIFEEIGAEVFWDAGAETVTAIKGGTAVRLTIGDVYPTVNGVVVAIDQPGVIVGGRTLAPLRFVAEAFGGTADWDGAANTVYITLINAPDAPPPYLYHSTVEYGEPDILMEWREPLLAYIRFPQSDDMPSRIIEDWAYGVFRDASDELAAMRRNDASVVGELNIHFDSYFLSNRYLGVLEKGSFSHSHQAHPVDVVQTFNFDSARGVLLTNADILDMSMSPVILSLLREKIIEARPEAAPLTNDVDDSWLNSIVIAREGIIVVLERGVYLPTYLGSLTLTLPYAELGAALKIDPLSGASPSEPAAPAAPVPVTPEPSVPNIRYVDASKPMVALTFDDGPSKYTSQILDLLEQYDCRATFCVVGNLTEGRSDTVLRSFNMGNQIIGHSYDHRDLTKLSAGEVRAQMLDPDKIIESITGHSPKLLRTPYGAVNSTVRSVAQELGFSIISWSVDTLDWQSRNADKVYAAVMADVGDRAIILCHDLYQTTAEAMVRVIPELISRGYQLVTVSELINTNVGDFEPGRVYYNGK